MKKIPNPAGRPPKKDYSRFKRKALLLLRKGYSVNDIQRSMSIPQRNLVEWRNAAGIKPIKSGFNSNRNRLPYLEPIHL